MSYISKQEETLLSYLVGLAPVGREFLCTEDQLMDDLCDLVSKHRTHLSHLLTGLCEAGAIRRGEFRAMYVVLKRPEDFRITWKGRVLKYMDNGVTLQ